MIHVAGLVLITCNHLETLLCQLYRKLLEERITHYLSSEPYVKKVLNKELEDRRTLNLFGWIYARFRRLSADRGCIRATGRTTQSTSNIAAACVPRIRINFPACMNNIYKLLEQGVKLKHGQRFYLTLFLKDLGMPLAEARIFWSSFYRKIKGGKNDIYWMFKRMYKTRL